jgi:hypothetical protein
MRRSCLIFFERYDLGRFSPAAARPAGTLDVGHYRKDAGNLLIKSNQSSSKYPDGLTARKVEVLRLLATVPSVPISPLSTGRFR